MRRDVVMIQCSINRQTDWVFFYFKRVFNKPRNVLKYGNIVFTNN